MRIPPISGGLSTWAAKASSCRTSTRPPRLARWLARSVTRPPGTGPRWRAGRGGAVLPGHGRVGGSLSPNSDATLAVDGVDGLYVGPGDLSLSLGCELDPDDPVLNRALQRVWAACAAAGKPVGCTPPMAPSPAGTAMPAAPSSRRPSTRPRSPATLLPSSASPGPERPGEPAGDYRDQAGPRHQIFGSSNDACVLARLCDNRILQDASRTDLDDGSARCSRRPRRGHLEGYAKPRLLLADGTLSGMCEKLATRRTR